MENRIRKNYRHIGSLEELRRERRLLKKMISYKQEQVASDYNRLRYSIGYNFSPSGLLTTFAARLVSAYPVLKWGLKAYKVYRRFKK